MFNKQTPPCRATFMQRGLVLAKYCNRQVPVRCTRADAQHDPIGPMAQQTMLPNDDRIAARHSITPTLPRALPHNDV